MRKITQLATQAFLSNTPFSLDNTQVVCYGDITSLVLHGHVIAIKDMEGLKVTTAGYDTNTTKERLKGLASVSHVKGVLHLNGEQWNGKLTLIQKAA